MRAFSGSNHAVDLVASLSRTIFIVFLNSSRVFACSKKRRICKACDFGSEFIEMKSCCEHLRGLRHKLHMFRIPVEHPFCMFGDCKSAMSNSSKPHSTL